MGIQEMSILNTKHNHIYICLNLLPKTFGNNIQWYYLNTRNAAIKHGYTINIR